MLFFLMPNFPDLADNGYFFIDKGENSDLYTMIKTFRHIYVINIYITSLIKGLKYKIHAYCLEIHVFRRGKKTDRGLGLLNPLHVFYTSPNIAYTARHLC